jgi:ribosome maturation factor RimP
MDTKFFDEMVGKEVIIRTVDDKLHGTLEEIEGDMLKVSRFKKDGVNFVYVNKNFICTLKVKNRE